MLLDFRLDKFVRQETHKAANRARQRRYLYGLGAYPTPDELRHGNTFVPSDPPVLTAEGALRLGAFLPPHRDPELPFHARLLGRIWKA